ncbi:MAG: hypothetical protein ACE5MI_09670 [Acidimicrobiia bacterium]
MARSRRGVVICPFEPDGEYGLAFLDAEELIAQIVEKMIAAGVRVETAPGG